MFTMKVRTDGDAFNETDRGFELAKLLRQTARQVEEGFDRGKLHDVNGNSCGEWKLTNR